MVIRVRTCFELWAFYMPHLNWYMSAFLLHSSAASARLRVLSVYGGAIVTAFSIATMTLYRWSLQSPRIIAIIVTHAHSLPNVLPRWWDIAGTEIAGWFRFTQSYWSKLHWFHHWVRVHRLFWCSASASFTSKGKEKKLLIWVSTNFCVLPVHMTLSKYSPYDA